MSYKLPVNLKSEQVWASRREHGWAPVPAERCPTVAEMPELMKEDAGCVSDAKRRKGLGVFIQFWNNTTDEGRERMVADDLPVCDLPPDEIAAAAAVVHGLCWRDDVETPRWALEAKAEIPSCLFTGQKEDSEVPGLAAKSAFVCREHNVFFCETFLMKV